MLFSSTSWSSNSGTALISFDLPSTQRWPSTRPCSDAQALTTCSGDWSRPRPNERRIVSPSMANTSRSNLVVSALTHVLNPVSNASGSISMNTRPNVSCEGMPFASSRKVLSQASFASAIQDDVVPAFSARDYRAHRDDQDVDQPVLDLAGAARVFDGAEILRQVLDRNVLLPRHRDGRVIIRQGAPGERNFMRSSWCPRTGAAGRALALHRPRRRRSARARRSRRCWRRRRCAA